MARDETSTNAAQIAAAHNRPALFVELACKSGFLRVWSGVGLITTLSRTFQGVGALGSISPIPETGELAALRVSLTLSGLPEAIVALSLDRTEYRGRPVRIWRGWMDSDLVDVVDAPKLRWAGRMSSMPASFAADNSSITLNCESRLVDLRRPRLIRLTHEAQQARFPGDRGLEYISTVSQAPIYWGGPGPTNPGGYGK